MPGSQSDNALLSLLHLDSTFVQSKIKKFKPPDGFKGRILTTNWFKLKQRKSKERNAMSSEPDELQVTMSSGE